MVILLTDTTMSWPQQRCATCEAADRSRSLLSHASLEALSKLGLQLPWPDLYESIGLARKVGRLETEDDI